MPKSVAAAPPNTSMASIQQWVCDRLDYTGGKAVLAKAMTASAMDWCATGYLFGLGPTKSPVDECKDYLHDHKDEIMAAACAAGMGLMFMVPFFGGIAAALMFDVAVGVLSEVIVTWITNDLKSQQIITSGWTTRNS